MIRFYCDTCGETLEFYIGGTSMFCRKCRQIYSVSSLKERNLSEEECQYLSKALLVHDRYMKGKCMYCGSSCHMLFSNATQCVKCGKKQKTIAYFMHCFDEFVFEVE